MSSTTLVTFLFESAPAARTIELLGSWDNFIKPYPMRLDLRKGKNYWSGCYSFDDIICDGDLSCLSLKRNGALKMGGTYWYYYKIDGNDECHDPCQTSTTHCPLLPGQRLNVLEVPYDSRSRSNSVSSTSSGVHTLDPEDKYLNPRPAPLPLPQIITSSHGLEDYRSRSRLDVKRLATDDKNYPRSAGYDSPRRLRSRSSFRRRAKSAAGSPSERLTSALFDFRETSDKIKATFDSGNFGKVALHEEERGRSRSARGTRQLHIGPPVLVSGFDGRRDLIPLSTVASKVPTVVPVATNANSIKTFSPLRSHPVHLSHDLRLSHLELERTESPLKRARSQVNYAPPTYPENFQGRGRALSAEHKRSKSPRRVKSTRGPAESIYRCRSMSVRKAREPSPLRNTVLYDEPISIPDQIQEAKNEDDNSLQTPDATWSAFVAAPPRESSRPASRHGELPAQSTKTMALVDKELPNLPTCLLPDPLFFHSERFENRHDVKDFEEAEACMEPSSHWSLWSNTTSIEFPALSSNGDGVYSPTFSSVTSNLSDIGPPLRFSGRSIGDLNTLYGASTDHGNPEFSPSSPMHSALLGPHEHSFLDCLHRENSSLEPADPFEIEDARPESVTRRHATCFGLSDGFRGYSLPNDQTASRATLTKASTSLSPFADSTPQGLDQNLVIDPTMTQLEQLMNDFGYLSEAVL